MTFAFQYRKPLSTHSFILAYVFSFVGKSKRMPNQTQSIKPLDIYEMGFNLFLFVLFGELSIFPVGSRNLDVIGR